MATYSLKMASTRSLSWSPSPSATTLDCPSGERGSTPLGIATMHHSSNRSGRRPLKALVRVRVSHGAPTMLILSLAGRTSDSDSEGRGSNPRGSSSLMPDRLMVGLRPLNPAMQVRYLARATKCSLSSTGQSIRLLPGLLRVRVLQGAPLVRV